MKLMREGEALLQRIEDRDGIQQLQAARRETKTKKEPTIMFYGIYNAGKSTLINVLCQKKWLRLEMYLLPLPSRRFRGKAIS